MTIDLQEDHFIIKSYPKIHAIGTRHIKDFLWNHFKRNIMSESVKGVPEWYKNKLMEQEV